MNKLNIHPFMIHWRGKRIQKFFLYGFSFGNLIQEKQLKMLSFYPTWKGYFFYKNKLCGFSFKGLWGQAENSGRNVDLNMCKFK